MTPLSSVEEYRTFFVSTGSTDSIPLEMQQKLLTVFERTIADHMLSMQTIGTLGSPDSLLFSVLQQRALEYFQKMANILSRSIEQILVRERLDR